MRAVDLEEIKIGAITIKVGTTFTVKGETDQKATVTRVTKKSIFVQKDGEEAPKLVVLGMFKLNIEKDNFVGFITPEEVKKEKVAKTKKLRRLSNTVMIHYYFSTGKTAEEIKELIPEVTSANISNSIRDAKANPEKLQRSVSVFLLHNQQPDAE